MLARFRPEACIVKASGHVGSTLWDTKDRCAAAIKLAAEAHDESVTDEADADSDSDFNPSGSSEGGGDDDDEDTEKH